MRQRAPHVDVVFGTHNVASAADLLAEARISGPVTEIQAESDEFPSALPVRRDAKHAAWVTIQIGCDNSCAFCIVPSVRGREISRPFGELLAEVHSLAADGVTEVTLLGQNVNSYGRDLGARDARHQQREPRQREPRRCAAWRAGAAWASGRRSARPLFADLLRAVGDVDGIERVRFTSPHPKDLRTDVIAAMAQTPSVCEHLHLPLQSGSDDVLAAMHRGYTADPATWRSWLRPALAWTTSLSAPTSSWVSPERPTPISPLRSKLRPRPATTARSRSCSRPDQAPRRQSQTDRFVPSAVTGERMQRLRTVIERSARLGNELRVGRIEEVVVEGPSKRDPTTLTGRTRQNRLVHFVSPEAAASRYLRSRAGAQRRHVPPHRRVGRGHCSGTTSHPHPCLSSLRPAQWAAKLSRCRWQSSVRRRPANRRSLWNWRVDNAIPAQRTSSVELLSADSMQVYRSMDIGTAKPSAAEQAAVPSPPH